MLQADEVMSGEMNKKVKKEYYRLVRKVLETELNSENIFKAINTLAISVVRDTEFLDIVAFSHSLNG